MHLHDRWGFDLTQRLKRFGKTGHAALAILLDSTGVLDAGEQRALHALADHLGDELLEFTYHEPEATPPTLEQQSAVDALAAACHARHRQLVAELEQAHGSVPCVRQAQEELDHGRLLDRFDLDSLPERVREQAETRRTQQERRDRYLAYRRKHSRRDAGIGGRLLHGTEPFAARLDRVLLRVCGSCGETIYPEPDAMRGGLRPADQCPYCSYGSQLSPPNHGRQQW